jgi:transcriptional regulator with XRE-family HTH domain
VTKLDDLHKTWMKEPAYKQAYDAFEAEFSLASALLKARGAAHMTQEDVAKAMGTTQTVIARLESGRSMPSTRTLQRFAKATGMRLRISFEPEERRAAR